jgi:hypothetical protein
VEIGVGTDVMSVRVKAPASDGGSGGAIESGLQALRKVIAMTVISALTMDVRMIDYSFPDKVFPPNG